MLITSCIMELRSRLRSCNVFITTSVDLTKNCSLKINIQANNIMLNYSETEPYESDDETDEKKRSISISSVESLSSDCFTDGEYEITEVIPIDEFCRIIPNSMSGLKVDKNDISFRILTEPKSGGNFYNELLPATGEIKTNDKFHVKIDVKHNEVIKLHCLNCSNVISSGAIKFERVLELPSENLDLSDWFCHNHGHGSQEQHEVTPIKPNKHDFLYRLCYFLINVTDLSDKSNTFNSKRDIYHCNRCLAWLGLKSKDKCSVKFYNSTIQKSHMNEYSSILKYKDLPISDDVICSDFVYIIERLTKDFNLGMQYAVMCKLLLQCVFSSDKTQYLLIWIMDRELQVLKNDEATTEDDVIKLVSCLSTKVLYKVVDCKSEEVEGWSSEPGVVTTEISKNMFQSGVQHLQNMSMKVPESFRMSNGFVISYLNV